MVTCLWYTHGLNFGSLSWFWRCKEHPCPLSPHLGLWRMLEVPDWGSASWSWFGYSHSSFLQPWSKFRLSILIFKVQRTSMSFKSSFGTLEDAGGSWLGFDILILIWLWSGTLLGSSIKFWSHSDWLGSGSDATSDGRKLSWTQIYTFRFALIWFALSIILNQSSGLGLSFDNYKGGADVLYAAEISWNREMDIFPNKGGGASRPVYVDSMST